MKSILASTPFRLRKPVSKIVIKRHSDLFFSPDDEDDNNHHIHPHNIDTESNDISKFEFNSSRVVATEEEGFIRRRIEPVIVKQELNGIENSFGFDEFLSDQSDEDCDDMDVEQFIDEVNGIIYLE